ncbi:MAG: CHASE3 domain-containing protein [Limnospira sp.]
MTSKIKLGPVIRVGFGITFFLMGGLGILSWTTINRLHETNRWVKHTYEVIVNLKSLEKSMIDTETGQRGFLVADRESFLEPYFQGKEDVEIRVAEIRDLTRDNPVQQENIDDLWRLIDLKLRDIEVNIQLKKDNREEEIMARFLTQEGKRKMDEVRAAIAAMIQIEEDLLRDREMDTENLSQLATAINIAGTATGIVLGILILIFIGREVVRPIDWVADQIGSSSSEISSTVEQQERTAKNQAAATNQTSTTMDELAASSRQCAEQAETAALEARAALSLSEGGSRAVERTLQGMGILQDKVAAIATQIQHLSEQTHQIGEISRLVSNLANQTNMLALNAAVEAVRAGEQGKGFSIVSGEIRKLADQSKSSAKKINVLVNEIQKAIDETGSATEQGTKTVAENVGIAEETARAFSGVTSSVNNIVTSSQQISLSVKEQATAIEQVLIAMNALNQASQETAIGITQVKEGTHRLNDAALQLRSIV